MKAAVSIVITFFFSQWLFAQPNKFLYHLDSATAFYNKNFNRGIQEKDTHKIFSNGLALIKTYLNVPDYSKAKKIITKLQNYDVAKPSVNHYKLVTAFADLEKYQFNYAGALNKYLQALSFFEKQPNKNDLLKLYVDLAEFYRRTANFSQAKEYLYKAHELNNKFRLADTTQLIRLYNRGAAIFNETLLLDSSIIYSNLALKLAKKSNNYYAIGTSHNELGYSYKNNSNFDLSLDNYELAQQAFKKIAAIREQASALQNHIELIQHNDPLNHRRKFTISKSLELLCLIEEKKLELPKRRIYKSLADDYFFIGDSLNYYQYKSMFLNEWLVETRNENTVEVKKIQEKFDNEKIKGEFKAANTLLEQSNADLKVRDRQNLIILIALIIFSLLTLVIGYLLVIRNKVNKELNLKNINQASLIQEIHHRVKNNLQFITSLINMQITTNSSDSEAMALKESARRIKSMALAHEMLYNDANNQNQAINIKNYLTELVNTIDDMVNTKHQKIDFNIFVVSYLFKTTDAIALGMITSEILSNAIKHAFIKTNKPSIAISLTEKAFNEFRLTIKDNGIGLLKNAKNNSLGMRLIDIFSRQLKGTYQFRNEGGLLFELNFKTTADGKH